MSWLTASRDARYYPVKVVARTNSSQHVKLENCASAQLTAHDLAITAGG